MTDHTHTPRTWQRFSPLRRLARFALLLAAGIALAVSFRTVQVVPEFLYDAPTQMADMLTRMWPPDTTHYFSGVHNALVETMHIAGMGTIIALALSLPVALLAANNITPFPVLNWFARLILVSSRSVNTLVWAILFVAVFGPGALAGSVAIGFRSIGFCGKLMGEALEECHKGPVEALRAAGAPWPSVILKAYWPQVAPAFWGTSLFRWDINVRESAVIGLVGAGGIGMALDTAINLFRWSQVSLILLCIFAVVILTEIATTFIRKRIL